MADINIYMREMKWLLAIVVVRGDLIFTLIWHICWMVAILLQLFTCLRYKIMFLHKNTGFCQQSFDPQMPRQHTHTHTHTLLLWSNVTFFGQWVSNVVGTALGQGLCQNNNDGPHKVESQCRPYLQMPLTFNMHNDHGCRARRTWSKLYDFHKTCGEVVRQDLQKL